MTTRQVTIADQVSEAAILLGSGAAVMNQLAMLGVGLGVAEHSTTLSRQADRLRTTLTYVYGMILGTDEERRAITRMVNKAHVPIRSEGRYNAFDPVLQLWVAATLAEMGIKLEEMMFGPLDPADAEQIYRDCWIFGTALQVKEQDWPQTRAEFETYWAESLEQLRPDPAVQSYARKLISVRGTPWLFKPAIPLQSLMARGLVPARTREVLDLPWTARDQKLFDLFWRVFPRVYRRVPKIIRTLPSRLYLRDFRRRMAAGQRVI